MIEVINGKGGHRMCASKKEVIRHRLPYGKWICADGREVLFNRDYVPSWQKINGVVSIPDPKEWVKWVNQEWFYKDATPYKDREAIAKLVLKEFGGSLDDILWRPVQEVKQWDSRSKRCFACRNYIFERIFYSYLACSHSFCSLQCAENHRKIFHKGEIDAAVSGA